MKFLQRVRFWIKNFTTPHILKKSIFLKSMILNKKILLKSTILENLFLKRRFKKNLHTKISFWFNLPRKIRKFCVLRAILKSTILKKNFFLRSMILNVIFFLKSMILNWNFFVLSDSNQLFDNPLDFECTSFAVRQIFMCSSKQGTFR